MRSLHVFIFGCGLLAGQSRNVAGQARDIPAGTLATQVRFSLNHAPEVGDRFIVTVSTNAVRIALVLPDGRRIDESHAESTGLDWSSMAFDPALGTTDGGHSTAIEFAQRGLAGEYIIEFDARSAAKLARVNVQFVDANREFDAMLRSVPGFRRLGPVTLTSSKPSATLDFTFARAQALALLAVVVTDPAAKISLTLPGGRIIESAEGHESGLEWNTVNKIEDLGVPGSSAGIADFLFNRGGMRRVFTFETATEGRYHLRAEKIRNSRAEVTAVFVPLGNTLETGPDKLLAVPPGQTRLRVYANPIPACFIGDPVEVAVGLDGDPIADPKFKVQLEYRSRQGVGLNGATQWGEPSVEEANVTLVRGANGRYTSMVFPSRAGLLRIGVQVSGKSRGGKTFSDDATLATVEVHRVVARLRSFTERAIPRNGTGNLERLDIAANLDIVVPGPYAMNFLVSTNSGGVGLLSRGQANLGTGEQTLTVSIPAAQVRKKLGDGPWTISGIQIFRPEGNSFGDFVATQQLTLKTAAYKRDQWDRGDAWSEEEVAVHGIYPAKSGRFQLVEIEFAVTTPGGKCGWSASLGMDGYQNRNLVSQGVLPPGKTVISFVFDAAMIARASSNQWYFNPSLGCDFGRLTDDHAKPLISVTLDPHQFEQQQASFFVDTQTMLRMRPGTSDFALIDVRGKKHEEVALRTGESPPGIDTSEPKYASDGGWAAQYSVKVTIEPGASAGRHFIPILATVGSETASTALVVDVIR